MNPLRKLFEAYGVELEYMIVDSRSLDVRPIADRLLHEVAGSYVSDVEIGAISWSNELVLHVVELKTTDPAPAFDGLPALFHEHVERVNTLLAPMGARLMPSAMHPWMDPDKEMKLWPHDYSAVYEAFDRVFDCRGHGWANLQSVHLNLPFDGDDEFGALHAAVRLVLPILPALAATSPIIAGRPTGQLDSRLDAYRNNARRVPFVSGQVVPEPVFTRADYETQVLQRMYRDIAPLDPQGILQHEWLNARGAIARFDRNTIEIRVLDVQECPLADVAICQATVGVLKALVAERWTDRAAQQSWATEPLTAILLATICDAERAVIADRGYLEAFGISGVESLTAGELWRHLIESVCRGDAADGAPWDEAWRVLLDQGPLARRILGALGPDPAPEQCRKVYRQLCDCLAEGRMFVS